MGRVGLVIAAVLVVLLLVALGVLAFWDPPAPSAPIEKVLPNERFQR